MLILSHKLYIKLVQTILYLYLHLYFSIDVGIFSALETHTKILHYQGIHCLLWVICMSAFSFAHHLITNPITKTVSFSLPLFLSESSGNIFPEAYPKSCHKLLGFPHPVRHPTK